MRPRRSSDALQPGLDRPASRPRQQFGAHDPFLHDEKKSVRDDLQFTEYTGLSHPVLRRRWDAGDKKPFHPYGTRSMEQTPKEMAGALDPYAGSAAQL